jgi:hypothetical protein
MSVGIHSHTTHTSPARLIYGHLVLQVFFHIESGYLGYIHNIGHDAAFWAFLEYFAAPYSITPPKSYDITPKLGNNIATVLHQKSNFSNNITPERTGYCTSNS